MYSQAFAQIGWLGDITTTYTLGKATACIECAAYVFDLGSYFDNHFVCSSITLRIPSWASYDVKFYFIFDYTKNISYTSFEEYPPWFLFGCLAVRDIGRLPNWEISTGQLQSIFLFVNTTTLPANTFDDLSFWVFDLIILDLSIAPPSYAIIA